MQDRATTPEGMPEGMLVAALRHAGCVFAEEEAAILLEAAASTAELADMLARRVQGQPLEHIVGWAQFCGLRMRVVPGVFVPRRRSEFLVERALAVLSADDLLVAGRPVSHVPQQSTLASTPTQRIGSHRPVVLDLCCGSGAVGAALAHAVEQQESAGSAGSAESAARAGCELHACDIDSAAVACAAANIAVVHGKAYCGDLFAALPESLCGRIDLIVANAPYVPSGAIAFLPAEARIYEPHAALNGGADGLEVHRRIAAEAPRWLRTGGTLLLESSARQARESQRILSAHGFEVSWRRREESDATVVTGHLVNAFLPGER
ncbi:putative protein N(5)-glutamine methyltransferase [Arthrobacter alpinus]|nr:putative protein N(5)-glutamine methyltransferase [Arthrobacter alpinus]